MPAAALHLRTFASPAEARQRLQSLRDVHGAHLHLAAEAFPALVRFTYLENLQLLRDALPPDRRVNDDTLRARLTACGLPPGGWPTENGSPLEHLVFLTLRATVDPESIAVLDLATEGQALIGNRNNNPGATLGSTVKAAWLDGYSIAPFAPASPNRHPALDTLVAALNPLASTCRRLFIFALATDRSSP